MSTKKIGLFGGSFNPIHDVHIEIGVTVRRVLGLDEIWLLIDKKPRNKADVASYQDRLHMAKVATRDHGFFVVDDLPQQKTGRTYDHNSLLELKSIFPQDHFTMIVGLDTALGFPLWERPDIFCENVDFAIVKRPLFKEADLQKMLQKIGPLQRKYRYQIIEMPENSLSSTFLRNQLKDGAAKEGINPNVHRYILENGLYDTGNDTAMALADV